MKKWTVYNYYDDTILGYVLGDDAKSALEIARQLHGEDVYVLPGWEKVTE